METNNKNTFPPLVSGKPFDSSDQKQLYGLAVTASCLIRAQDNDWFFHPILGLNGYAFDGYYYINGVKQEAHPRASWWSEGANTFRSSLQEFPMKSVALVTDAGLSILEENENMNLWMNFLRENSYGYTDNFCGLQVGFKPVGVMYNRGVVSVLCYPDRGSEIQSIMVNHMDFVKDSIYVDMSWPENMLP